MALCLSKHTWTKHGTKLENPMHRNTKTNKQVEKIDRTRWSGINYQQEYHKQNSMVKTDLKKSRNTERRVPLYIKITHGTTHPPQAYRQHRREALDAEAKLTSPSQQTCRYYYIKIYVTLRKDIKNSK